MEVQNFEVIVVGNAGVDTNVYLGSDGIDNSVESNFTENIDCIGQAGGYSSRGFAQLGKKTAFIGCVGDDHSGRFVRETLAQDGIDLSGLFIDPTGTSRSVNFVFPDGGRKNFYDGKGHMDLQPDLELCRDILSKGKLAHFSIPNWARQLIPIARELGLTISCDIQDTVEVDDTYRLDFIRQADFLFTSGTNFPDPAPLIDGLRAHNEELVIIVGMGAEGCALATVGGIELFPVVDLGDPVIDTNGAGDALAIGFLSSYVIDGYSLVESVNRAQIAARHVCTLRPNSSELITQQELDRFYRQLFN